VLLRLDHVASRIVNADHSVMRTVAVHRVADCVDRDTEPVYWGRKIFARSCFTRP
jgi:hypothetical protein